MSTRGCVIGNSHVAALKLGWQAVKADYPEIELDFFAGPRQRLGKTFVRKGVLTTKDEIVAENLRLTGGSDKIDLRSYDFFCVSGGGASSRILLLMQANHMPYGGANSGEMYISEAYLRACYEARLRSSAAKHLVDLLTAASTAPVFYVPDPHLSNERDVLARSLDAVLKVEARNGFDLSRAIFTETVESVFSNATEILFQLPETLDGPLLTKVEFARGPGLSQATDQADEEPEESEFGDIFHLNSQYGALFWAEFFRQHQLSGDA